MTSNASTVKRKAITASGVVEALGTALLNIKNEDGLTWPDMGRILGKSGDRVALYCAGQSTMDVTTFAFARERWNGRFSGALDRMIGESRGDTTTDREKGSSILKAALALSIALEDDDMIDSNEVHANRKTIEAARDALTALLGKLELRAA